MKPILRSILAICACVGFQSCMSESHDTAATGASPSISEEPGQVALSVDLGPVGVLARSAQMTPTRLILRFVSNKADTVRDTQLISGRSAIAKVYSLPSQRRWTLSAVGRDQRDSVLYSGAKTFDVLAKATTDVGLSLDAGYSSIRARFPVLDSMTRFVLRVDGVTWVDSSVTKQKRVGDTIKADHDYLSASSAGIAHPFAFRVYGKPWGVDTLLYSLDTTLKVVSGQSATRVLNLKWVGPTAPPPGAANLQVTLGSVGQLVFQVGYGDRPVDGLPWNSEITYGKLVDARDGQSYRTVTIGMQTWMAQNLNYRKTTGNIDTSGRDSVGVCYGNSVDSCSKYGRLYTWAEAMGLDTSNNSKLWSGTLPRQGVCPSGWRIPSDAEWTKLTDAVGGPSSAGTVLKSTGGWVDGGSIYLGTDDYGFRVLPAGYRVGTAAAAEVGISATFWTSSESGSTQAWIRYFDNTLVNVYRSDAFGKFHGFSLRCLQN